MCFGSCATVVFCPWTWHAFVCRALVLVPSKCWSLVQAKHLCNWALGSCVKSFWLCIISVFYRSAALHALPHVFAWFCSLPWQKFCKLCFSKATRRRFLKAVLFPGRVLSLSEKTCWWMLIQPTNLERGWHTIASRSHWCFLVGRKVLINSRLKSDVGAAEQMFPCQ